MKLVKVKIKLPSREEFVDVINELCKLYLSHTGAYEAPISYIVTVYCSHIDAEKNLDIMLAARQLYGEKSAVAGTDENLAKGLGVPATLIAELERANAAMRARESAA